MRIQYIIKDNTMIINVYLNHRTETFIINNLENCIKILLPNKTTTQIKEAIKKNKKYSTGRYRTNYDTSFEYNPECKKAWYSEEFKDCGNGHYYLALNETHAMHYEDN